MACRTQENGFPIESSKSYLGMFPEVYHYLQVNHAPSWDNYLGTWMPGHFERTSTIENMFIIKTGPTIRKTEIGNVFIKMSKINIFFFHQGCTWHWHLTWCINLKNFLRSLCRQGEKPLAHFYYLIGGIKNGQQDMGSIKIKMFTQVFLSPNWFNRHAAVYPLS